MDTCMQNRGGKDRAEADWEGMRQRGSQCAALHLEEERVSEWKRERERERQEESEEVREREGVRLRQSSERNDSSVMLLDVSCSPQTGLWLSL